MDQMEHKKSGRSLGHILSAKSPTLRWTATLSILLFPNSFDIWSRLHLVAFQSWTEYFVLTLFELLQRILGVDSPLQMNKCLWLCTRSSRANLSVLFGYGHELLCVSIFCTSNFSCNMLMSPYKGAASYSVVMCCLASFFTQHCLGLACIGKPHVCTITLCCLDVQKQQQIMLFGGQACT